MSDKNSAVNAGEVVVKRGNGIGKVGFFHPLSNSLPGRLLRELANSIIQLGNEDDIRVIILYSRGEKAFCAGASFDELTAIKDLETGTKFFLGFAGVINAIRTCGTIVIGRVQGKAVGGGVGLASACDYCLATEAAAVKLSELAVGIGPFVVGPAVQRKIGVSAMSQLAIDATTWQSAGWAREKGLYTEIFPTIAAMDEAMEILAVKLSESNPEALAQLKGIFWEGTENWDVLLTERAAISGKLVLSDFTRNAIEAFKSKK